MSMRINTICNIFIGFFSVCLIILVLDFIWMLSIAFNAIGEAQNDNNSMTTQEYSVECSTENL